jgi:hypothetical protein
VTLISSFADQLHLTNFAPLFAGFHTCPLKGRRIKKAKPDKTQAELVKNGDEEEMPSRTASPHGVPRL